MLGGPISTFTAQGDGTVVQESDTDKIDGGMLSLEAPTPGTYAPGADWASTSARAAFISVELTASPAFGPADLSLMASTNVIKPGENQTINLTIQNDGFTASNVMTTLTSLNTNYFSVINSNAASTINGFGGTAVNVYTILAQANTPAEVYNNAFRIDLTGTGTDGSINTASANVAIEVLSTVFSSINQSDLSAPVGGTDTATLTVSNTAAFALQFSLSDNVGWLTYPTGTLNLPAGTATNITITADASLTPGQGQYSGTLSVNYLNNGSVPDPTDFSLIFDVGPKVAPLVNARLIVEAGGINQLGPDVYEPGEILNITIPSTNSGSITVSNITHTLTANPAYFSITAISNAAHYGSMVVGDSTTTTYQVTIAANTPHGTYTFSATNTADGTSWQASFDLLVYKQADPSVSTNALTIHVPAGGTASSTIILTNKGNASTSFTISDNGPWDVSYAVTHESFSGWVNFIDFDVFEPNSMFFWDDDSSVSMDIDFTFPLFGTPYTTFSAGKHGAVALGGATVNENPSGSLPLGTSPIIAPFWSSLATTTNEVRYKKETDRLIVSWTGVDQNEAGGGSGLEFQTWLHDDGRVHFLYRTMNGNALDTGIGLQDPNNSFPFTGSPLNDLKVLLTPVGNPWVIITPSTGTLPGLTNQTITFTADATDQSAGTTNYTALVTWGDGSTSEVLITVIVDNSSFGLLVTPNPIAFEGPAGYITQTNMVLSNTGDVAQAYTITDTGAQAAGYNWVRTNFNWDSSHWDANSVDAITIFSGDDKTFWIPIGFSFPFYGNVYTQFKIDTDGLVVFTTNYLTDTSLERIIAPYATVLELDRNATLRYSGNANQIVVSWENMYQTTDGADQTFQLILYKNGDILFQYAYLSGSSSWPNTPSGLLDTTNRVVDSTLIYSGTAENPGTVTYTTNYTTVTNWGVYDTPVVTTNGTNVVTAYSDTVTEEAILFTLAEKAIITVNPASGTIPVGGSQVINIYGDARSLTPGGSKSVLVDTTLDVTHPGGTIPVDVEFVATNSIETSFADMPDSDDDGRSDVEEVLFGSDGVVRVVQYPDNSRTISWPNPDDSINRNFIIWFTTNLTSGWEKLKELGNATTYTDYDHANEAVIYYKVTVE